AVLLEQLQHVRIVELEAAVGERSLRVDARRRAGQRAAALDRARADQMRDLGEVAARPRQPDGEGLARHLVPPLHAPPPPVRVMHRHARLRARPLLLDEPERRDRRLLRSPGTKAQVELRHVARIAPETMTPPDPRTA